MLLRSPLVIKRNHFSLTCMKNSKFQIRYQASAAASPVNLKWEQAKPFIAIPGPKPLPIPWGNWWRFTRFGPYGNMDFTTIHKELRKKYGPIVRITGIGKEDIVYLYDADYIETMYRNDGVFPIRDLDESFKIYMERKSNVMFEQAALSQSQGEKWRNERRSVQQVNTPKQTVIYIEPINEVADIFIKRMKSLRDSNSEMPENFSDELAKWSLESVINYTLGTRVGWLKEIHDPESDAAKLIKATPTFVRYRNYFNLSFTPPIWKYVSTPEWKEYAETNDLIFKICAKYVFSKIEEIKVNMKNKNFQPKSLMETFYCNERSSELAVQFTAGLLIGGAPVATAAAVFLSHISKNSDKQEKLFHEIKKFLPSKESPVTSNILEELKYLKACIKESMRISPSGFGNQRRATRDYVIQQYRIPKGALVYAVDCVTSVDGKYFQNSEKFIPERWLRSEKDSAIKEIHPFANLPFGYGVRLCLGKRFVDLGLEIILAKIIRNFKVDYNHGDMIWENDYITQCAKPLQFKIEDRVN